MSQLPSEPSRNASPETPGQGTNQDSTRPFDNAVSATNSFDEFVRTIAILRSPNGCPWDKQQTHASISRNMLEEAYEAVDAIEQNDIAHLREELGDVLLQVVLQSQIAADAGEFTIDDVCADINAKMIRRHPHIFGDAHADSASDVSAIWEAVKLQELEASRANRSIVSGQPHTAEPGQGNIAAPKESLGDSAPWEFPKDSAPKRTFMNPAPKESLMDSVPKALPSLVQAQKISRKAVSVGFEWETLDQVWAQVHSEIDELKAASPEEAPMEFGDVLFSLVNVARKMGFDAEMALRQSCNKFRSRWAFMEGVAWAQGKKLDDYDADGLQDLWQQAKRHEAGNRAS